MNETTTRRAPVVGNLSVRRIRHLADRIGDIGEGARTRPVSGDDTRRDVITPEGSGVGTVALPGGVSLSCDLGRVGDRWQATVTLSSPGGRHRETGRAYRAPHAAARDALTDMAAWLLYQADRFGYAQDTPEAVSDAQDAAPAAGSVEIRSDVPQCTDCGRDYAGLTDVSGNRLCTHCGARFPRKRAQDAAQTMAACSQCGKPADAHACAVAPTLQDHFTSAEFYGTCAGDPDVWAALYPEVAPASEELGALLAPEGVPVERSEYRRASSELLGALNATEGDAQYVVVARFSQAATRAQAGLTDFEVAEVRALRKSGEVPAEVEAVWRETLRIFTGAEMSDAEALRSEIARHRAEAGRRTGAGRAAAEANAERFQGVLSRLES